VVVVRDRRETTLRCLGLVPGVADLLRAALEEAVGRAEVAHAQAGDPAPAVAALDAGCGRRSALTRYRSRLGRLAGADVHRPAPGVLPCLDEFATVDLCADPDAFPPASFDVVLCSFTVEHLADPPAAFGNIARWLRPGGTLVISTVNRRHPFVAAYLTLPDGLRGRLQPLVKATAADAHPLVGACNDPRSLRDALTEAGFTWVRVQPVGHLARAWGRRRPAFLLGLVGDLLARGIPSRRSTLVVAARVPAARR
jgi:SAM-dependent methyltransferase